MSYVIRTHPESLLDNEVLSALMVGFELGLAIGLNHPEYAGAVLGESSRVVHHELDLKLVLGLADGLVVRCPINTISEEEMPQ